MSADYLDKIDNTNGSYSLCDLYKVRFLILMTTLKIQKKIFLSNQSEIKEFQNILRENYYPVISYTDLSHIYLSMNDEEITINENFELLFNL